MLYTRFDLGVDFLGERVRILRFDSAFFRAFRVGRIRRSFYKYGKKIEFKQCHDNPSGSDCTSTLVFVNSWHF